jgi:hypothetical protein
MVIEWLHRGKPTGLGLASGLVAGLVAITPASGFVNPLAALAIGLVAGGVCYGAVCSKPGLKYDDSLDAFGVHGIGGFLGALLTGVLANYLLVNNALGNMTPDKYTEVGKLGTDWAAGRGTQMGIQALAATVAAIYAFVVSLVLVKVIDLVWGFSTTAEAENVGLDRAEHNEVGFDFGLGAVEEIPEMRPPEPRPARVPPDGHGRYTIVVDGPAQTELLHAWSEMCQAGKPSTPAFRAVYPYVTTVQGNRFRFRGGDRVKMRTSLQDLFQDSLGETVHAHVEE